MTPSMKCICMSARGEPKALFYTLSDAQRRARTGSSRACSNPDWRTTYVDRGSARPARRRAATRRISPILLSKEQRGSFVMDCAGCGRSPVPFISHELATKALELTFRLLIIFRGQDRSTMRTPPPTRAAVLRVWRHEL